MADYRESLNKVISELKRQRDELALQIHLGGMEAKEEFQRLSKQIDELNSQYEPVRSAVSESSEKVFSALKLAAQEMQHGITRIWDSISKK